MKPEEAIKELKFIKSLAVEDAVADQAIDMAIDALKKQAEPTCCGYDIQQLIAFGQICRRHGIQEYELKDFITNCGMMWQIMQKEFENHIHEDVEYVMNSLRGET